MTHVQPDCRLYLVVEAGPAAADHLSRAAAAADVACCLIVPAGAATSAAAAKPIVETAQRAGVAALLQDADLALALRADGVHLGPARDLAAAYAAARQTLGREAIVGADVGLSRHNAMSLAEAGADYVAFGAPAHLTDRARARQRRDDLVTWWGEIFEVPCVALDVEMPAEAERLARAGANFIAVRLALAAAPTASCDLVTQIGAAIGARAAAG